MSIMTPEIGTVDSGEKALNLCFSALKLPDFNPETPRVLLSPRAPRGWVKRTSHFYIIGHRSINVVCMCRSTNYLGICALMYYV